VGDKPSGNAPTAAQLAVLIRMVAKFRVDTVAGAGTRLGKAAGGGDPRRAGNGEGGDLPLRHVGGPTGRH